METKEYINQFFSLQSKSDTDLQAICKSLSLPIKEKREDLIKQIISDIPTKSPFVDQAIYLKSTNDNGSDIPEAIELFKQLRKQIFNNRYGVKNFRMLTKTGDTFFQRMNFIKCDLKTLETIFRLGCYCKYPSQKDFITAIIACPDNFVFSIIRKENKNNSFIMLHCHIK